MRLFLALTPTDECMEAINNIKPTSVLMSYYYLRAKSEAWQLKFFEFCRENKVMLFIDSGAFTFIFQKNSPVMQLKSVQARYKFFEKYSNEYADFLRKWWGYIDMFAEVDVDSVIGYKNVLKLRKIFLPSMTDKFVPVHHPESRPFKDWVRDCAQFEFLAIGSSNIRTDSIAYFKDLVKYSHSQNKKVHGFALINHKILSTLPFYSADSSSWMSAMMFGNLTAFDPKAGKLKTFHYRDEKLVKKYFKQISRFIPDINKMYEELAVTNRAARVPRISFNGHSYQEYEVHLTKLWAGRGVVWP